MKFICNKILNDRGELYKQHEKLFACKSEEKLPLT